MSEIIFVQKVSSIYEGIHMLSRMLYNMQSGVGIIFQK